MDGEEECPQCGSTVRNIEGGTLFCAHCGVSLGPVAFVAEEQQDYQERGKVLRKKETKVKQNASRIYRGRKGYRLFLQAWQHILWRQCHAAIHVGGLPAELWNVVKDLWALRLSVLAQRFEEKRDQGEAEFSDGGQLSPASESATDTTISVSEDEELQAEVKSSRNAPKSPKPIDMAALLYIGTLLLRYPCKLETLFDWIKTGTIPFLRPIRYVPAEIKRHLAGEYNTALDTNSIPKPEDLQMAVLQAATMNSTTFGMTIPPLNFVPLLVMFIEQLALPMQVYIVAKQLNAILEFDFAYPASPSPRRLSTTYPEAQLMSLVVVATKLLFPFDADHVMRHPKSLNEPCAMRLDWSKWLESKAKFEAVANNRMEGVLQPGAEISVTDVEVMDMKDEQLDQYMDWYQNMFARVKERDEGNLAVQLLQMFPVADLIEPAAETKIEQQKQREFELEAQKIQRLQEVLGSLETEIVIAEHDEPRILDEFGETVSRPGTAYQSFKDSEALDGVAKLFYQEAAIAACLTLDQLVRAANHTEQMIERWRRNRVRCEVWPEDMEIVETEFG